MDNRGLTPMATSSTSGRLTNARSKRHARLRLLLQLTGLTALFVVTTTALADPATVQILYSFPASPAGGPGSVVLGSDGNFYGTTRSIGEGNGAGIVFRMTPEGTYTSLYVFDAPDGLEPGDLIQGRDGNFYGTTARGGSGAGETTPYGLGTVFKISPAGVFTSLYSFTGMGDGAGPWASLVEGNDGNFYGIAGSVVFKITSDGVLTPLHTFTAAEGSGSSVALVQGNDGDFYGRTDGEGGVSASILFKITPAGTLTTLYTFPSVTPVGASIEAALVQASDGNFYGTTIAGGTNNAGSIFKLTPEGAFTTLYSFSGAANTGPEVALVEGSDGRLYGTTSKTLFAIVLDGTLTTLYSFPDYWGPTSLVEDGSGTFYGTTFAGGTGGGGTFFKMTLSPAGQSGGTKGGGGGALDAGLLALLGLMAATRLGRASE